MKKLLDIKLGTTELENILVITYQTRLFFKLAEI